ncbi:hypothetical protein JOF35_004861 [Streptomyces demainii]|uniref:Uncharacterized protein n=1 Tax=Streptomyces demainii TaxID=588122 RepID=A0ABT9KVW3_9ACTN|nr:hypothetical protein [Streptomyces demainii]
MANVLASPDEVTRLGDPWEGADAEAVAQAARRQAGVAGN